MQSKGQRPKRGVTPATPPGRTTRVSKKSTAVSGVLPTLRSRRDCTQVRKIALTQVSEIGRDGSIDGTAGASNESKIALGGTIDGAAEASNVSEIALGDPIHGPVKLLLWAKSPLAAPLMEQLLQHLTRANLSLAAFLM